MERYFEVSNALIKSEGVIWDDHNGGFESKLIGLAALFNGKEVIPVGLHSGDYFSLNRVYLKDGKVHLSDESVAGVLFPVNFRDVWDCINDYNDKQAGNKFSCGTLENPMSLKPIPVTVITMTIKEFCIKTGKPVPVLPEVDVIVASPEMLAMVRSDSRKDLLEKVVAGDVKVKGSLLPEAQNLRLNVDDDTFPVRVQKIRAQLADGTFDYTIDPKNFGNGEGHLLQKDGEAWIFDDVKLPAARTQAEVEEMQRLVDSGITPEEANKQVLAARAAKLRPLSLNPDFHPDDEVQEAYYRELLAQKEKGDPEAKDPSE